MSEREPEEATHGSEGMSKREKKFAEEIDLGESLRADVRRADGSTATGFLVRDDGESSSSVDFHYFTYATQFYVAARFAAAHLLINVAGGLFHQSIELYLKGVLTRSKTYKERKNLSHDLKSAWREFKHTMGSPGLDGFDAAIERLDFWRWVRYPDDPKGGTRRGFMLDFTSDPNTIPDLKLDPKTGQRHYQLIPDEMEKVVCAIFEAAKVAPDVYLKSLMTKEAQQLFAGVRRRFKNQQRRRQPKK